MTIPASAPSYFESLALLYNREERWYYTFSVTVQNTMQDLGYILTIFFFFFFFFFFLDIFLNFLFFFLYCLLYDF